LARGRGAEHWGGRMASMTDGRWQADAGRWKVDAGRWKVDAGRWKVDAGRWKVDAGRWKVDAGRWKVDAGRWKADAGRWKVDAGRWKVDAGRWKADAGRWKADAGRWKADAGRWTQAGDTRRRSGRGSPSQSNGRSRARRATHGMLSLPGARSAANSTAMSSSETMASSGNVLRQTPAGSPSPHGTEVAGAPW